MTRGVSVSLLAPLFDLAASTRTISEPLPSDVGAVDAPAATGFNGTLDSVNFTGRGYGVSGPLSYRLIVEINGGSNHYITGPLALSGGVLTAPGAGGWYNFSTLDPHLQTAPTPAGFTGTGNLTAVGVWVTETINYAGGGTGTSMAGYGISFLQFNGTEIPEPASLGLLLLGGLALRRRRL